LISFVAGDVAIGAPLLVMSGLRPLNARPLAVSDARFIGNFR
jgi:hypothetical protein